jgi:methionine salvage enolase-phosphatase E1
VALRADLDGCGKISPVPGFDSWTVSPVAFADSAIPTYVQQNVETATRSEQNVRKRTHCVTNLERSVSFFLEWHQKQFKS